MFAHRGSSLQLIDGSAALLQRQRLDIRRRRWIHDVHDGDCRFQRELDDDGDLLCRLYDDRRRLQLQLRKRLHGCLQLPVRERMACG